MRLPRVRFRFTIRRILLLIAVLAMLLRAGRWTDDRYGGRTRIKHHDVGDLIRPYGPIIDVPFTIGELSDQAALLRSSITPDVWWLGTRSVAPYAAAGCLTVRHTDAGHRQVAEWLLERRDRMYGRKR